MCNRKCIAVTESELTALFANLHHMSPTYVSDTLKSGATAL